MCPSTRRDSPHHSEIRRRWGAERALKVLSLLGGGEEEGRRERSLLSGFLGREQVKQTVHHL